MTVTHVIHTIQINVRASSAGAGVWGLGSGVWGRSLQSVHPSKILEYF